jgi:2-oxoglutarate ferredoxin oxidoreductase subunit alpha
MGLLYFGTTAISVPEAMEMLDERDIKIDTMRIRAFPFSKKVEDFIDSHEKVFLVEQNRDAQLRALLVNECEIDPAKIMPILNYDGSPITAKCIVDLISEALGKNTEQVGSNTVAAE